MQIELPFRICAFKVFMPNASLVQINFSSITSGKNSDFPLYASDPLVISIYLPCYFQFCFTCIYRISYNFWQKVVRQLCTPPPPPFLQEWMWCEWIALLFIIFLKIDGAGIKEIMKQLPNCKGSCVERYKLAGSYGKLPSTFKVLTFINSF